MTGDMSDDDKNKITIAVREGVREGSVIKSTTPHDHLFSQRMHVSMVGNMIVINQDQHAFIRESRKT